MRPNPGGHGRDLISGQQRAMRAAGILNSPIRMTPASVLISRRTDIFSAESYRPRSLGSRRSKSNYPKQRLVARRRISQTGHGETGRRTCQRHLKCYPSSRKTGLPALTLDRTWREQSSVRSPPTVGALAKMRPVTRHSQLFHQCIRI